MDRENWQSRFDDLVISAKAEAQQIQDLAHSTMSKIVLASGADLEELDSQKAPVLHKKTTRKTFARL